jgi:hypothetical protein
MYVRCVFVQYEAVCHYRRFVCVSGAAVRVRSGHAQMTDASGWLICLNIVLFLTNRLFSELELI